MLQERAPIPDHPRNFDYLERTVNIDNRVRNLETGVHPTSSPLLYYDTTNATEMVVVHPLWEAGVEGLIRYAPTFQRRVGIVQLGGEIETKTQDPSNIPAWSVNVFRMPSGGRPLIEQIFNVPIMFYAPFYTQIKVKTDGWVDVARPQGSAWLVGRLYVRLEGPTWFSN